ncbi:MAG TPA: hypothetical protein VHM25_10760 [Polyangiaceae bacterium]|nr:hypothetical protein [Polyangiaceae bacterium]
MNERSGSLGLAAAGGDRYARSVDVGSRLKAKLDDAESCTGS